MKFKTKQKIALGIWIAFVAILVALDLVLSMFFDLLAALVHGTFSTATNAEITEMLETGTDLAEEIEGEGVVLVQNNEDVLPLEKSVKEVNVFGWSSTQWVYGGSGSGRVVKMDTDFLGALEKAGIAYNAELTDMYKKFRSDRPFFTNTVGTLNSYNYEFSRLYEPSVNNKNYYSEALLNNARSFSDTAIVTIGRVSGESNDSPKTQYKQVEKGGDIVVDTERTYLEISTEEKELLTYVGANYKDVIVLINSTNAMELGFLETIPGLDAALIVGGTGTDAATAIVKVLYGDITPSGKTVDTYSYEFETNASYVNAGQEGEGAYTNSEEGMYPYHIRNANVGDSSALYEAVYYADYVENVYIGYKWFETADVEGYWDDIENVYGSGYNGVVQYPFGFGLSYTQFHSEIVKVSPEAGTVLTKSDEITVTVNVKNTGNVKGKEVVQLYYTAPYTSGGIEKSAVELCAFAKTKELAPGQEETVTLSFRVYDMASYDAYDKNGNGFAGYEVEGGNYTVSVRSEAHTVLDSVNYQVAEEGIRYEKDPDTNQPVVNRFTGANAEDGVSLDGSDSEANIKWLTRADFKNTFPKEKVADRAMTDNVKALNLYTAEMAEDWKDDFAQAVVTGEQNGIVVYDENGITELGKKLGRDYDDPDWEKLLNQLTLSEMEELFAHYYVSPNADIPSIGKYKAFEADGPTMIGSFNAPRYGTGFPMPTVLAQTWSTSLASDWGSHVGLEAANLGYDGWYAPGINLHRSPFGGRNYEYYSEDAFMSGTLCAEVVNSSLDRGVYCYVKHFVAYDQDANRDSLYVWMTEQALRENYLKSFEIAVKAGATGLMSSYNRIGAMWTGGSAALNVSVLRGEWQFRGAVLSDFCDHPEYVSSDQMLRAGGDQILFAFGGNVSFRYETESNSYMQAVRGAAKNSIYIWLNALARNADKAAAGEIAARNLRTDGGWLRPVLITLDVVAWVGLAFWCFRIFRRARLNATQDAN